VGGFLGSKHPDGFVKSAGKESLDPGIRDAPGGGKFGPSREVEPIDRIQEEECANPGVEVSALPPEPVEGRSLGEQFGVAQPPAGRSQRAVSGGQVSRENDVSEHEIFEKYSN
jgi:hypothetical protein